MEKIKIFRAARTFLEAIITCKVINTPPTYIYQTTLKHETKQNMIGLILFVLRAKYENQRSLVYFTNSTQVNTRSFRVNHRFINFFVHY